MANPEETGEKRPEKTPLPKESKPSGSFSYWVRGGDAWKVSQMPESKRKELPQRLFGSEGYTPKKANEICQDIERAPGGSLKKYGFKDETEMKQVHSILKGYLG